MSSPVNGTSVLPTGVGSGFILDYKGESFFVTADHVVNTHDNGIRRVDKNAFIQTNNIAQDENGAQVALGEKKKHLDSSCICVADKDEDYFVFGRVKQKYELDTSGQIVMQSELISHNGLKYLKDDGNYYVLKYSKPVVLADWKGLSGSPVINHQGGLIGIACAVSSKTDEVWVKKIQCMLPLFDAEILTNLLPKQ